MKLSWSSVMSLYTVLLIFVMFERVPSQFPPGGQVTNVNTVKLVQSRLTDSSPETSVLSRPLSESLRLSELITRRRGTGRKLINIAICKIYIVTQISDFYDDDIVNITIFVSEKNTIEIYTTPDTTFC